MKHICLIGNNAFGQPVFDGQRIKVRTYKIIFETEGFDVNFVELDKPYLRLLHIFSQIKKGIKECDVIVLITSDNGEKLLIPYINKVNKKYKKRFIFSQIGTSFLYNHVKSLTEEEKRDFFHNYNFGNQKPKAKVVDNLRKIDIIMTETDLITGAFSKFFGLSNCFCMTNFRIAKTERASFKNAGDLKLMYLSRINEKKGIFDLLEVVKGLIGDGRKVSLDIYGTSYLSDEEQSVFNGYLNESIKYCGELLPENVLSTIKNYNMLCFPTKCEGEGTPGCIIESLIAGVPVLSSSFTQSDELLKNNVDSLIYKFEDKNDLKLSLLKVLNGEVSLQKLGENAFESGKKFTYDYNRDRFLELINGEKR